MVKDEQLHLRSLCLRADVHILLYLSPKTEIENKLIGLCAERNLTYKRIYVYLKVLCILSK